MTTRKHPHEPEEFEARLGLYEGKIAELESQLAETREKYLRLAADFDNYKKRMRQEQLDTMQHASAEGSYLVSSGAGSVGHGAGQDH